MATIPKELVEFYRAYCIIDEYTFERMQNERNYDEESPSSTYEEFIEFNRMCVNELNVEDKAWLQSLCKRIQKQSISLMDEESCSKFTACSIYFDQEKNICIVNPR